MCVCVCACMCASVRQLERETDRQTETEYIYIYGDRQTDRKTDRERDRERQRETEREREIALFLFCAEMTFCQREMPCKHGGTCVDIPPNKYACVCPKCGCSTEMPFDNCTIGVYHNYE